MRLTLAILVCLACAGYVWNVEARLQQMEQFLMCEPGYLCHSHYSAGTPPILREVKTRRLENETLDDWQARHAQRVADSLAEFPPV